MVHIANEASTTNEAVRTITALVTLKDLLEEYNNEYAYKGYNLEKVLQEIDRINSALEEQDLEVASELSADDQQVLDIIRASRLTRKPFTPSELQQELSRQISEKEISSICNSLYEMGMFDKKDDEKYTLA